MAARMIDALAHRAAVVETRGDDVANRLGIARAQFLVPRHLHPLHQSQQFGVRQAGRFKLFRSHLTVGQRDGHQIREAVVGSLAAGWAPFLRLAANDVHGCVVTFNQHGFDFPDVRESRPHLQRGLDGALGMIFSRPPFHAGFQNHERFLRGTAGRSWQFEAIQRAADELLKSLVSLEDRRRSGHSCAGEQRRKHALACRVGERATFPM